MKEIAEIKTKYNYSFEYSEKFKSVNSSLVYLTTMIYFMYKYKDHCSGLNINLIKYIKNTYNRVKEKDFKQELMVFDFHRLGLKYDLKTKELKGGLICLKKCLEKKPRFIYIFLAIENIKSLWNNYQISAHANIIIYDTSYSYSY